MADIFSLDISPDKKEAWISLNSTSPSTKGEVIEYLRQHKVINGLQKGSLEQLLNKPTPTERLLIAEYTPPLKAIDDRLIILVDTEIKPAETRDKRVDYYNLDFIKDIQKGTKIFDFYLGRDGCQGTLIDGTALDAGKERAKLNIWKMTDGNCRLVKKSAGHIEGFSKIDGSYLISKDRIALTNNIVINSELNFKTGNLISRYSSIQINGGIKNNFIVSSPADVTVAGNIENSEIIANNLFAQKGILKGDKLIHLTNTMAAEFITNRNNIYTKFLTVQREVRNSEIGVLDSADIHSFAGGSLYVYNNLTVAILGGEAVKNSEITMGLDKYKQDCLNEIIKKLKKSKALLRVMKKEKLKIKNELDQFKLLKQKEGFIETYDKKIKHLEDEFTLFSSDLKVEEENIIELLKEHNVLSASEFKQEASIRVTEKLHPGTVIRFGLENRLRTRKAFGPCLVRIGREMEIEIIEDEEIR